jgi:hypothetical protein
MAHLATMMQGFHPFRLNSTRFQKTVAINDFYLPGPHSRYPLGQIQSQGRTHGVMAQTVYPQVPLGAYEWWVSRGVDWLVMSEDLPRLDNRVIVESDGRIRLYYRPNNLRSHRMLVGKTRRILRRLGFWAVVKHSHGRRNTTHQCGTLVFGLVLPIVGGRESRADDHRPGAEGRGSHSHHRAQATESAA